MMRPLCFNPVYKIWRRFRPRIVGSRVALIDQSSSKTPIFAKMKAQDLSAVLTDVWAYRLKLPHPVYRNTDYRIRECQPFLTGRASRNPDGQEIHSRRCRLQGVAAGHYRAGAAARHQA